jgi:putative DNA primase/helicase
MMLDFDTIRHDALGKWPAILTSLGVDIGDGKHGPCPFCGGKDRFRFDDKEGRGTWICNQCGAGDGIKAVMLKYGDQYPAAMRKISDAIGHAPERYQPTNRNKPNKDIEQVRVMLRKLWSKSQRLTGSDPVSLYLRQRRLYYKLSDDVRYCPECYESDTKTMIPAMVAIVRDSEGKPAAIHRTYLDGTGKANIASPKKLTPTVNPLAGGSIRLFDHTDTLGIAEGIETAIAARQLFDVPTWAAVSSTILEGFNPPDGVRVVYVFADNDANFTGQAAAYKLAKRLYSTDIIVKVEVPEAVGDWADINCQSIGIGD